MYFHKLAHHKYKKIGVSAKSFLIFSHTAVMACLLRLHVLPLGVT